MRIVVVAHTFPPASEAGSEIYARNLALAMRRRHGDEILVLAREADSTRRERTVRTDRRDGLTIAWINNTFADVRDFADSYASERLGAVAASVIDDFAPDVAHIHHLTCLSTAIVGALNARRIPIVCTLHDYWLMCHRGQRLDRNHRLCAGPPGSGCRACLGPEAAARPIAFALAAATRRAAPVVGSRALAQLAASAQTIRRRPSARDRDDPQQRRLDHMRALCSQVTRFIAPSLAMRDAFVAFGIDRDRISVSRYGFDCARFRDVTRAPAPHLRLGFVGSVMASKAPHLLLEAACLMPAGTVSVDLFGAYAPYHGDDSYRVTLEPLVTRSGARMHGAVPHADIPQALGSIDVLVVPSIWPENSPLVVGEAFLAGMPVVASRLGGLPELVEDGRNGLLFRAGDAADLARTLARLVDEHGLLDHLRRGAAATPVRPIEDDAHQTRQLFEALASSRVRRRARIAAVVLNYRAADDTLLAVQSLRASRRAVDDIIVIDNDADEAANEARVRLPLQVAYRRTGRNLGYSGGMNIGIREALRRGADRVLLVNSDVVVPPNCIDRLERALEMTPAAGIAGPLVIARADPDLVASAGMSYVPGTGRMLHRCFGTLASDVAVPSTRVVDGVSGCLMLVTRLVFDAIGLLDEDYFFSFEDLDFCLRARRAGFATVLAGAASVHHEGGRSIGAQSPRRLYFAARGHLLLAERAGPPAGIVRSAGRLVSIVALNVAHAARSRGGSLPLRLTAVARGVRDYFAGRFGPDADAR